MLKSLLPKASRSVRCQDELQGLGDSMAIQSIDCRKPSRPACVANLNRSASTFYDLHEDVPAHSELVALDFQAGDRVEVDPFVTPTDEDVLMLQAMDGTHVLVSLHESAGYRRMTYVGVVITHLRPWTDRRRTEHERTRLREQQKPLSKALATLTKGASSRLSSVLDKQDPAGSATSSGEDFTFFVNESEPSLGTHQCAGC